MTDKTFTAAQLARELELDPKVARRRLRANAAKGKEGKNVPREVASTRKNGRYTWADNKTNREAITAIIQTE